MARRKAIDPARVEHFTVNRSPGDNEGWITYDVRKTDKGCEFYEGDSFSSSSHEFSHSKLERLIVAFGKCLPPDRLRSTIEKLVMLLPSRAPDHAPVPTVENRRVFERERRRRQNGIKNGGNKK